MLAMMLIWFADITLVCHGLFVLFIIAGLLLTLYGGQQGWRWVRNIWFRAAHLAGIGLVVLQAWLGVLCPLTVLEHRLRLAAGQAVYQETFIQHWLQRLLFYQAPLWVFTLVYSLFALLVLYAWWRYPPRR